MAGIYVTSLESGAGKTAVALSLASLLASAGKKTGYVKPGVLGDDASDADTDVTFAREALGLTESVEALSPRQLKAGGLGEAKAAIVKQWDTVSRGKDVVVAEGLGASGDARATSVELADALDTRVVLVVRYRRAIELAPVTEAAKLYGDRLAGVLLNAVPEQSLREAREEAAPALAGSGVPVLGIVPEDRMLLGFTVSEYSERLDGVVMNNGEHAGEIVESLLVGAMVVDSSTYYYERKERMALVTRADRPDLQWNALDASTRCLILTGGTDPIPYVIEKAKEREVPLVVVPQGTLDIINAIEGFVTAPTFHHPEKLRRYGQLLRQHADFSGFGL
jgi:BioD-like phosphotransacetylase family protein